MTTEPDNAPAQPPGCVDFNALHDEALKANQPAEQPITKPAKKATSDKSGASDSGE